MKKFFDLRLASYLGGLLLSLTAMLLIFQAKRAFMPAFHEIRESRPEARLAPGGNLWLVYNEDPGQFLIPGLPSRLVVSKKQADGTYAPVIRLDYGSLVNKENLIGPLRDEGAYQLEAELFICAGPGVAECAKLLLNEPVAVAAAGGSPESRLEIDLPKLAQAGLEAGKEGGVRKDAR